MVSILLSASISFILALFGTPFFIKYLTKKQYGQFIRQDGPKNHYTKRGTPTMGGVVIIFSVVIAYFLSCLASLKTPNFVGILLLFLMVGLGFVGFLDDYKKIKQKQSLGLKPIYKIIGQGIVGILFSIGAITNIPIIHYTKAASTRISFIRDTGINLAFAGKFLGIIFFIIWVNFLITSWSNAVNLADGLDGLAPGTAAIAFLAYLIIILWQLTHICSQTLTSNCYVVKGSWDLGMITAGLIGACLGFIWWNASPAKIFMGDTGSLAIGGIYAGISILSRTELLAVIIGGLFVIIIGSDVIQILYFKISGGKRVFKMAPLHHHFEMLGWQEITIVIRFWLIAIICAGLGIAIFYGSWVVL
jgi:phospho-N-acetylmuramoyl-pentapeptide-transferase